MTTVRVYTKDGCNHCEMAKEFLDEREMKYEVINDPAATRDFLVETTGQKTFPYIYVNNEFIGGLRELMDMYDF